MSQPPNGPVCPDCGAQVSEQQGHCGNCGANLGHGGGGQTGEQPRGQQQPRSQQQAQGGQQQGQRGQQQQPPPNQPPRQQPAQQQQQGDDGWSTLVIVLVLCGGGLCLIPVVFIVMSAVLGSFVLGLGDTNEFAPATSFEYDYNETTGEVEIQPTSGDTFNASQVRFEGDGLVDPGARWHEKSSAIEPTDSVGLGDSVVVEVTGPDYLIEIAWESSDGETRVVIDTNTGPEGPFGAPDR
jgi:hypothetical protein